MRKFLVIFILLLLVVGGAFVWWKFFYVFGEGVKAGEMNFFVKKGYVFKTYEGRLIQTGYRSQTPGSIQSNEFEFSVENERVAQRLSTASGNFVELHYKEYMGVLPWRGNTKYVVDSILAIREMNNGYTNPNQTQPLPPQQLPSENILSN